MESKNITYNHYRVWKMPETPDELYKAGDEVAHLGKILVSNIDGNNYEPSVGNWTEKVS